MLLICVSLCVIYNVHCTCMSQHNPNQYLTSDWIHYIMTNDCSYLSQFDKSNCDEVKRDEALIRTDCSALRCFFISTFLKRGHLMTVHLFLTLHTGIALYGGPLQTNACSRSTSVIKDLPVLHCSITDHDQNSTSPNNSNRFNLIEAYQTEVSSSTFPIRRRPTKDGPHWWAITPSKVKHFPSPSVRPLVMWSPF